MSDSVTPHTKSDAVEVSGLAEMEPELGLFKCEDSYFDGIRKGSYPR